MLLELVAAAAVGTAGTIALLLWVDHRCALDGQAMATLAALVLGTVAGAAIALRLNALDFELGAVAGVLLALAGWTVVVLLTTRPAPVHAGSDPGGAASAPGEGDGTAG